MDLIIKFPVYEFLDFFLMFNSSLCTDQFYDFEFLTLYTILILLWCLIVFEQRYYNDIYSSYNFLINVTCTRRDNLFCYVTLGSYQMLFETDSRINRTTHIVLLVISNSAVK